MVIEIQNPDIESLIRERINSGAFHNAEDVVGHALWHTSTIPSPPKPRVPRRSLATLFAESPFRGLEIDFDREQDYGGDIIL